MGEAPLSRAAGTLELLIAADFSKAFPRVVIEGAPGQGKSTVTQFLCQIHRMALLPRETDLAGLQQSFRPQEARLPFRIDLRDYASWISGRDPFGNEVNTQLSAGTSPVLESFLAAQVRRVTGRAFTVEDLATISGTSQILIVLDGFDEVADIPTRNRLVDELSDAAVRLEANAISLQIVVTSRPAAFANSPGLPKDKWRHVQMLSLSRTAISRYAEKWLDARRAEPRERRDIIGVLAEKLNHSHVRDLARNPMQLAILLALISVQGASLPDKRTALYDRYIDVFFDRESEKSVVVRDHRGLLIHIHRFLAWVLQVEAETNAGAGNISESRLPAVLRTYLIERGHGTDLVDRLFTGMVERVVALVSRVQGTFEFEVQPLREYFAARHLYDTAPYAPPGTRPPGTLPDRFSAISRNFYWLNVARFFAGCYSSGELSSLIDGIDDLRGSGEMGEIAYPLELSVILLSDYVFSQHPKLVIRVVSKVVSGRDFLVLISGFDGNSQLLSLPDGSGKSQIIAHCQQIISADPPRDVFYSSAHVLSRNSVIEDRLKFWLSIERFGLADGSWLALGGIWGCIDAVGVEERIALVERYGYKAVRQLLALGLVDVFQDNESLWKDTLICVLEDASPFFGARRSRGGFNDTAVVAGLFMAVCYPFVLGRIVHGKPEVPIAQVLEGFVFNVAQVTGSLNVLRTSSKVFTLPTLDALSDLFQCQLPMGGGGAEIACRFVERARESWGERWALIIMAVRCSIASPTCSIEVKNLWDSNLPLCDRALFARLSVGDLTWWRSQLREARQGNATVLYLCLLSLWTWESVDNILALRDELADLVDGLSDAEWSKIARYVLRTPAEWVSAVPAQEDASDSMLTSLPTRVAVLLMQRLSGRARNRVYEVCLRDYCGADRSTISAILDYVYKAGEIDSAVWAPALPRIASGYKLGIFHDEDLMDLDNPSALMPREVAESILAAPESYPLGLISRANRRLTAAVSSEALAVGNVAKRDGWFLPET